MPDPPGEKARSSDRKPKGKPLPKVSKAITTEDGLPGFKSQAQSVLKIDGEVAPSGSGSSQQPPRKEDTAMEKVRQQPKADTQRKQTNANKQGRQQQQTPQTAPTPSNAKSSTLQREESEEDIWEFDGPSSEKGCCMIV